MHKFKATVKKHNLIQEKDKILVAVSGGPDSMALLLLLASLRKNLKLSLFIAHLDHGLRKESNADALFVKTWASKLGIPLVTEKLNQEIFNQKGSLEELLRDQRLSFLIKTAKKIKADKIALGHNLDDQAETVLMRILRGTGLSGLSGISLKREIQGLIFIRPLLEINRREINQYLKKKGIKPRIDSTNQEDVFLRNRIRHNLIPLLRNSYNANITQVLVNLAESVAYDYEYLDRVAKKSLPGNCLNLNLSKIKKMHPSIMRLKLRQSIAKLQGDTRRISFQHIKELQDLIFSRPKNSVVNLPKGILVKKTGNFLRFFKR